MPAFDIHECIKHLSQELVLAYEASRQITTAGTKGDAREAAVREKLGLLLPAGAGVGSVPVNATTDRGVPRAAKVPNDHPLPDAMERIDASTDPGTATGLEAA